MIETLLFTAPVLLAFGPLLAGRYPGEKRHTRGAR